MCKKALGVRITNMLYDAVENPEKIQTLTVLSGIGELLAHQIHAEFSFRKAFISPGLSKDLSALLDETNLGSFHYGENLSERIEKAKLMNNNSLKSKSQPTGKSIQETPGILQARRSQLLVRRQDSSRLLNTRMLPS